METEAVREYFYELTDREGLPDVDVAIGVQHDQVTFIHNTLNNQVGEEVMINLSLRQVSDDHVLLMQLFSGLMKRFMAMEHMRVKNMDIRVLFEPE